MIVYLSLARTKQFMLCHFWWGEISHWFLFARLIDNNRYSIYEMYTLYWILIPYSIESVLMSIPLYYLSHQFIPNRDPLEKPTPGGPDVVVDRKSGGSHVGSWFFFSFDRVESLVAKLNIIRA